MHICLGSFYRYGDSFVVEIFLSGKQIWCNLFFGLENILLGDFCGICFEEANLTVNVLYPTHVSESRCPGWENILGANIFCGAYLK